MPGRRSDAVAGYARSQGVHSQPVRFRSGLETGPKRRWPASAVPAGQSSSDTGDSAGPAIRLAAAHIFQGVPPAPNSSFGVPLPPPTAPMYDPAPSAGSPAPRSGLPDAGVYAAR